MGHVEEGREAVPEAPGGEALFDDVRAAPAVLTFLRDTRVGKVIPQALRRRRGEIGKEVDREGEPGMYFFLRFSFVPLSVWCVLLLGG